MEGTPSPARHLRRWFVVCVASAALVLGVGSSTAFGKKPPHTRDSGTTGSAVNPNPAAAGETYTVTGTGLPAGRILNVFILEAMGTQVLSARTDDSGAASVMTRSY